MSETRRFSIRPPRPLWFLLAAGILSLTAAVARDSENDESGENAPLLGQRLKRAEPTGYRWLFGGDDDAVAARKQLDMHLRQRIAIVDHVCGLTDAQKQQLELAGRGDNKRLSDHIEEFRREFQSAKNDQNRINELHQVAQPLIRRLNGIPSDDSLLVKMLEKILTADQLAKWEPIRVVDRAGGLVQMRQCGPDKILEINLTGTAFADDGLVLLGELPNLHVLALGGTRVTDTGLKQLKRLASLKVLWLYNTAVSDSGLAHLNGLASLESLKLSGTKVTDAGLVYLKELTGLKALFLDNTKVTGIGMIHLNALANLEQLSLASSNVTDAGLAKLSGLSSLRQITLENTLVGDAGLAHLNGMSSLRRLALGNTQVTDTGLLHLKGMAKLENLSLDMTRVTDAGVAEMQRILPGLKIVR